MANVSFPHVKSVRGNLMRVIGANLLNLLALWLFACTAHAAKTVTYYYTDNQGTVLATTDAAGNILSQSDRRPYGDQVLGQPQDGPGYTGHVEDTDTSLVYAQARYYDPLTGRFLSLDPAGIQAGDESSFGRYGYASDNPIRFVDPDGRQEVDADELELETRQAMARLNPPLGPNMASPSFVPAPMQAPLPETYADHLINQSVGLEPTTDLLETDAANPAGESSGRTYQVYEKTNSETGEVYTGRTSGTRSPDQNVAARDRNHHMNSRGFGPAQLKFSSTNSNAIRGQEQANIEANGGAKSQGGTSGNAINGVGSTNPKAQDYDRAAKNEFEL